MQAGRFPEQHHRLPVPVWACAALAVQAAALHLRCQVVDPGYVPLGTAPGLRAKGVDALPPGANGYCSKCLCVQPARCYHCGDCGRCVLLRDHHCPWIDNCVGAGNIASFGAFVLCFDLAVWCQVLDAAFAVRYLWQEVFAKLPWTTTVVLLALLLVGTGLAVAFSVTLTATIVSWARAKTTNEEDREEKACHHPTRILSHLIQVTGLATNDRHQRLV